jgi:hypothetical protein
VGSRIPEPIRSQVIKEWLLGTSRAKIVTANQIGAGTVSSIINECKEHDSEFILLRKVALMMRQEGMDLKLLSSSIRLKRKLDERSLTEEQLESFIQSVDNYCFKQGYTPEELISIINNIATCSDKFEIAPDKIIHYLIQRYLELKQIKNQLKDLKMLEGQELRKYNITIQALNEYRRSRPLIENLEGLKKKLKVAEKQMDYYAEELARNEIEKAGSEYQWCILEHELDLVNKKLPEPVGAKELFVMAQELFGNPSKYVDIIPIMRERALH